MLSPPTPSGTVGTWWGTRNRSGHWRHGCAPTPTGFVSSRGESQRPARSPGARGRRPCSATGWASGLTHFSARPERSTRPHGGSMPTPTVSRPRGPRWCGWQGSVPTSPGQPKVPSPERSIVDESGRGGGRERRPAPGPRRVGRDSCRPGVPRVCGCGARRGSRGRGGRGAAGGWRRRRSGPGGRVRAESGDGRSRRCRPRRGRRARRAVRRCDCLGCIVGRGARGLGGLSARRGSGNPCRSSWLRTP